MPHPHEQSSEAVPFLRVAFAPDDWIALFLKNYEDGRAVQRVGPVSWAISQRVQTWLHDMNGRGYNIYVSVNAIKQGRRSRTRDAIARVRHVFLDLDHHGAAIVRQLEACPDLPAPSYVLHSSPDRLHVFWRVSAFEPDYIERLQRHLARRFAADSAATPVTQTTRIPGYFNLKYREPHLIWAEYRDLTTAFGPADFPSPEIQVNEPSVCARPISRAAPARSERALAYLNRVPPAVAGQHGDLRTFQVCCRLVRGFAIDEDEAFVLLQGWNAQCLPPWSERELREKLRGARQYGREPVGGLL